jgi:hypothetical protein
MSSSSHCLAKGKTLSWAQASPPGAPERRRVHRIKPPRRNTPEEVAEIEALRAGIAAQYPRAAAPRRGGYPESVTDALRRLHGPRFALMGSDIAAVLRAPYVSPRVLVRVRAALAGPQP